MFWTVHLIGWLSLHHLVVFFSGELICSFIWAFFFCLSTPVTYKGRSLRCSPGRGNTSLRCDTVCGGGVREGTVLLALLSARFQSLPLLPTVKLGLSGADSWVGGFVYVLGPCGPLRWTLLWGWEFLSLPQPPQVFSTRGFEVLFPCTGTLGCARRDLYIKV